MSPQGDRGGNANVIHLGKPLPLSPSPFRGGGTITKGFRLYVSPFGEMSRSDRGGVPPRCLFVGQFHDRDIMPTVGQQLL